MEELQNPMSQMDPMAGQPMPQEGQELQYISEDERQDLLDMITEVRGMLSEVERSDSMSAAQIEAQRIEALRQVLMQLEKIGVDLTDPEAVRAFIEELREFNPEMAAQFEQSIADLIGEDEESTEQLPSVDLEGDLANGIMPARPTMNNEIQNEDLSEDLRGPQR